MASRQPALPLNRVVACVLLGAGAVGVAHLLLVADIRSLIPWLAGGVGTGLALRWGRRAVWPLALGAAVMAIALGYPLPGALLPALATFSGALVLATLLERFSLHPDFGRRGDVLRFVAAGLLVVSQLWSYALILSAVVLSVQALLAEREASERRLLEMVAGARIGLLAPRSTSRRRRRRSPSRTASHRRSCVTGIC